MNELPALMPAAPEIFLAVASMALMMAGVFAPPARASGLVHNLALATLVLTLGLVSLPDELPAMAFNGMFVNDRFALFMKVLVLLGSIMTLIMGRDFTKREGMDRFEYSVLMLFATLGMMMMISANDLIALYLGLELQSLALYVIAAIQRDRTRSSEAGLKYFVLGALASGLLLYGCSLVYGFAGTTSFATLAEILEKSGEAPIGLVVGLVFLIAGLAFKVSAVPFHMWTPDVYEGAPTPVTAFFSVAPKIAAIALFLRVMVGPFGELAVEWQQIIVFVSVLSMALGAVAAIAQRNIKRLMAYSSIGHVGYALIGLAAGSSAGVRGVLLYLAIYLAMSVGCFACILCMRRKGEMVENIDDLAGLARTNPAMALAMLIFMFSMAGIPPTAGFFGKLYVFLAAVEAGLYTLAVIGVISSVVAAFYYLRIVKIMYFDEPLGAFDRPIGRGLGGVLTLSAVVTLFFFLWPAPVLEGAAAAAASLFIG